MPRINKRTAVLLIVFILTVAASVTTLQGANQAVTGQRGGNETTDGTNKRFKSHFPLVDYDAPEEPDPDKQKERREKGKRYDQSFVSKHPSVEGSESVFHTDWYPYFEALPVRQSQNIVVGVVKSSEAHLSSDKTGVYTEFAVEIREVLKSEGSNLTPGKRLHADRPGGYVRYPGGHERLYRFADLNMPAVEGEYLFFLTRPEQSQNYEVLTAYELSPQGITPLDSLALFRPFTGMERDAFLSKVRELVRASN
jgi:hypothetical protein